MFKSLSRLFNMSKVPASTRPIAHRLRPGLQLLEDRTTPAVSASFSAGTLTINLSAASDIGELTYVPATTAPVVAAHYEVTDGPPASSSAVIIANYNLTTPQSVTRIIIKDIGSKATGQEFTVTSLESATILTEGFSSTGVETVNIDTAITGVTSNGITITAATEIALSVNLGVTSAPISLNGPVALSADVVLTTATSGNVTFGGTIVGATNDLTVTSAGSVSFGNTVGAGDIAVSGTLISLNGNVTGTEATLTGPVKLLRNITIDGGAGDVTFTSTLNSDSASTLRALTVTGTGDVKFGSTVGATFPLASLAVTATGTTTLTGNITTGSGAGVSFADDVELAANTVITTSSANVTFSGLVDSPTTARFLTVVTGTGTASFLSDVGATDKLAAVTVTSSKITLAGDFTTKAGANVVLTGATTLNGDVTITTDSTTDGNVTLNGSIDSLRGATAKKLTIVAGTGTATLNAATGGKVALDTYEVTSAGTAIVNGVLKAGTVDITADTITINSTAKVTGDTKLAVTLAATNTNVTLSGAFVGDVAVDGSTDATTNLISANDANFTLTGDLTTVTDGTLSRVQKGVTTLVTFTAVDDVSMTGGAGSNIFNLIDWKGTASVHGGLGTGTQGTDTVIVSRANELVQNVGFTLAAGSVSVVTDITKAVTLASIESASLVGGPNSNDTFTITGWNAPVRLEGGVGGDDTLVWTGAGNATLTRNVFTASIAAPSLKATFANVGFATITGTAAANIFTINGYGGVANIIGGTTATATDNDTLNVITSATEVALADTSLSLNGTISTLSGMEVVNFTGSAASQNFDISGWTGPSASISTITGGGGVDQLVDSATSATTFTLSAATYRKASLATWTLAKVGVSLTGSTADDNFVINSFTAGKVSVNGNGGTNDKISSTADVNFLLTGSLLSIGTLKVTFADIDAVFLTGGAGNNSFGVNGFLGAVTLDGVGGTDTYNIKLPVIGGDLVVTVSDTGSSGSDVLTATPTGGALTRSPATGLSGSIFRTGDSATTKKPRIDFTGIETVTSLT